MSYDTRQDELEILFSEVGNVVEVFMPADRDTGRPRGFAFVEFTDAESATAAIEKFDGTELNGRKLGVREAEERQRPARNFSDDRPYGNSRKRTGNKPKGSRRNIRARKRGF